MKVVRSFVEPGTLSVYRPGDSWPRPGVEPAPGVLERLRADGLIEQEDPAPAPAAEPVKAEAPAQKTAPAKKAPAKTPAKKSGKR